MVTLFPWFYMGTPKASVTATSYTYDVDMTGGNWNNKIFGLCQAALQAENESDTDTSNDWTWTQDYGSSYKGGTFLASRALTVTENGTTSTYHITLRLFCNSSDRAALWVYIK